LLLLAPRLVAVAGGDGKRQRHECKTADAHGLVGRPGLVVAS
jgi:hypothetical protein